jgi:class 3 adenylate cyclase
VDSPADRLQLMKKLSDQNRVQETRKVLAVIANYMAMPLYVVFWGADLLYVPHLKWEFLIIRLGIVPAGFLIQYLANRAEDHVQSQRVALLFNLIMGTAINYMIFRIHDPTTGYYAGLNLIAIGNLAFIPLQNRYFALTATAIYLPYFLITGLQIENQAQLVGLITNSFFVVGTIVILFVTRQFNEALRAAELSSTLALMDEIDNREQIIATKTKEAIQLESMSRQFSPQVLAAIKAGSLQINQQVHRAKICAIFIDIVNSTERVTRIDKDKVHKVIAMFMEDTIKTLLKYDITIDKFLGDGVLAFCNDPIERSDYVYRSICAALEIKEKISKRQFIYENYWMNELQIRIGVADGFANIGFYGSDKYFHAYTAIGAVMNLASRLCAAAEPNQILVSNDVMEQINADEFEWDQVGKKTLKGFEQDVIKTFSIKAFKSKPAKTDEAAPECPKCGALMYLETTANGIYEFTCRTCSTSPALTKKSA